MNNKQTIKELKEELDQLINEVQNADPEQIEESGIKLKRASEIITLIEEKLKFSEVEIKEIDSAS
jgi:response regulator RpfG family c-di-GMP phosphodiesterase